MGFYEERIIEMLKTLSAKEKRMIYIFIINLKNKRAD